MVVTRGPTDPISVRLALISWDVVRNVCARDTNNTSTHRLIVLDN